MTAFSGMEFTLTFPAVDRFLFSTVENGLMFVYIVFFLILTQGCWCESSLQYLENKNLLVAYSGRDICIYTPLTVDRFKPIFYCPCDDGIIHWIDHTIDERISFCSMVNLSKAHSDCFDLLDYLLAPLAHYLPHLSILLWAPPLVTHWAQSSS